MARAKGGTTIAFGDYALMARGAGLDHQPPDRGRATRHDHHVKRGGKVWIRIFPDKPVTKKPAEVRMGSGKGAPDHWVAVVKPGRVMFEMAGVPEDRGARRPCAWPATSCPWTSSSWSAKERSMDISKVRALDPTRWAELAKESSADVRPPLPAGHTPA